MTINFQALVFDTETTSLEFRKAEVIELAAARWHADSGEWIMEHDSMYCASEPISPMVSSITHITERMVQKCLPFSESSVLESVQDLINNSDVQIAHNLFYDAKVLERYDIHLPRGVCTLKMAKKLYPDLENHKLGYLRYYFDLAVPDDLVPHRARADVEVTALLFELLLNEAISRGEVEDGDGVLESLLAWINKPTLVERMPFGKHKGKRLSEIPTDYWAWALDNMNILNESLPEYDDGFAESVRRVLEERLG